MPVNGILNSRNTSMDTRNPASRKITAMSLAMANGAVTPNRLRLSPAEATNAPMAMRIVAGTREWSLPDRRALTACGSEAMKLTVRPPARSAG